MESLGWSIKICGITCLSDARAAVAAGADAIGLNFWQRSLRSVDLATARSIARDPALQTVARVGVFVNESPAAIARIADECGLGWIQLHGDETPSIMASFPGRTVIRALRPAPDAPDAWLQMALDWLAAGARAILLDAPRQSRPDPDEEPAADAALSSAEYGGTGRRVDPALAAFLVRQIPAPVILAGGLNPGNVAEAIRLIRPAAVDAASGVESGPARKGAALVSQFVQAARAARS